MPIVTAPACISHDLTALAAGLILACAATVSRADPAPQIRLAAPATAAPPRLDLSRLASPYDAGKAMKAAGVAYTAIDRSLQGRPDATASLGFLCGGQPNTGTSGASGALGTDRDGRFLGAQLRLGFR